MLMGCWKALRTESTLRKENKAKRPPVTVLVEMMDLHIKNIPNVISVKGWPAARKKAAKLLKGVEDENIVVRLRQENDPTRYDFVTLARLRFSNGVYQGSAKKGDSSNGRNARSEND